MKKHVSLVLTAVMTFNMAATPVYAVDWNFGNIVDDIVDTVEKGVDEVVDTVKKGADWVDGATDDTMNWINVASEDTQQWLSRASDDTVN